MNFSLLVIGFTVTKTKHYLSELRLLDFKFGDDEFHFILVYLS